MGGLVAIVTALLSVCLCVFGIRDGDELPHGKILCEGRFAPLIMSDLYPAAPIIFSDGDHKSHDMRCQAKGHGKIMYKWLKNGHDFDPATDKNTTGRVRRVDATSGTLRFDHMLSSDEGIYTCVAQDEAGTSEAVPIVVRRAFLDSFPPSTGYTYSPRVGTSLILNCNPPRSYPDPTISWVLETKGQPPKSLETSARVVDDLDGNLYITHVESGDRKNGSTYACQVKNSVTNTAVNGDPYTINPHDAVNVGQFGDDQTVEPMIRKRSEEKIIALKGHPLLLLCIFAGSPTPKVAWELEGAELSSKHQVLSAGTRLSIPKMDIEDAGLYTCIASNAAGSSQPEEFHVSVKAAPYWITEPHNVTVAPGDTVKIKCPVAGDPTPVTTWYVNGHNVSEHHDHRQVIDDKERTYTLRDVTATDSRVIWCNSTNSHGHLFAAVSIQVACDSGATRIDPRCLLLSVVLLMAQKILL